MWTTFAGAAGGAAAGLTGLTFIVVAVRYDTLAVSEEYRNRAAQTISLYLTITVAAILITVPQPVQALGIEMMVIAVLSGLLLTSLDSRARRHQTRPVNRALVIGLSAFVATVLASGLTLALGHDWGLFFFVASAALALVVGVTGAWTFLTRAGMDEPPKQTSP